MMTVKTEVLGSYVCTLDWLEPRIAATKEGQLHSPTPCSEWDVETLLNHMLWTMLSYASLGEHGRLEERRTRPTVSGGAYSPRFRSLADRGRAAWSAAGALKRECDFPFLGRAPGGVVLGVHVADLLIHGWDLSRATGQDDRMDEGCAEFALHFSKAVLVTERRDHYFDPPIESPNLGNAQATLIAYSGRHVNWTPGGEP